MSESEPEREPTIQELWEEKLRKVGMRPLYEEGLKGAEPIPEQRLRDAFPLYEEPALEFPCNGETPEFIDTGCPVYPPGEP